MAAITRPNYLRAAPASNPNFSYSDTESPKVELELDGSQVTGPLGLYEIRAKKTAGGADDTTIRAYAGPSGNLLIYEQVHHFANDDEWVAFQLPRDEIVRGGEIPTLTAQSTNSGSHQIEVYAYFTVAAVQ